MISTTVCDTSKIRRSRQAWPLSRHAQSDWVRVFKTETEIGTPARVEAETWKFARQRGTVHEHLVRAGCMFFGISTRRTLTRLHRTRSRLYAFPVHSRLHSDPLQAVFFALECNLRGFFLLAMFWNTPTFMQMRLLAGIRKRCHFETAIKVNAQVVCITELSAVAAHCGRCAVVCQFLSSAQQFAGRPWKYFHFLTILGYSFLRG